jgi:hypothetical protein
MLGTDKMQYTPCLRLKQALGVHGVLRALVHVHYPAPVTRGERCNWQGTPSMYC